jgi:hypothetical protein
VDRRRRSVRLTIESLEGRAAPAQLGPVITLPEVTGHGADVALSAPEAPGTGLKIDGVGHAALKIDGVGHAAVKIETWFSNQEQP